MWKKPHNWLIAAAALVIIVLLGMDVCHAVNPETGVHYAIRFKDRLIYIVFLAITNAILLLGFQIWILVDFFTTKLPSGLRLSSVYSLSIGAIFPLIAIILLALSVRFAANEGTAQRIQKAFNQSLR